MNFVVIGGAGLIGSKTVAILRQGGPRGRRRLAQKRHQHHHGRGACGGRSRQFALI